MLTRIEIDGFKTFSDFSLDLGPFTFVFGLNASGKSNLFDAIHLLSALATSDDVRSALKDLRGEAHDLFSRNDGGLESTKIKLAAEVLLAPVIEDPYGAKSALSRTRIRYEIEIERRRINGVEKLFVVRESAAPITAKEDKEKLFPKMELSSEFKKAFIKRKGGKAFLETKDGQIILTQDGQGGRKRIIPAAALETSVLSTMTSATFTHMFALREEMKAWRFLYLDPVDLRASSAMMAPDTLHASGSNLPTALARIRRETMTQTEREGALTDIKADLAAIIPGVTRLEVREDTRNRKYDLLIGMRNQPALSAAVASDGTLRILALLTLLHDPRHQGLVCMEEPENGIHPHRLKELVPLLRGLTLDPTSSDFDSSTPLSQILMNSHSPVALSALADHEIVFLEGVMRVDPQKRAASVVTNARRLNDSPPDLIKGGSEIGKYISKGEIRNYLRAGMSVADNR